MPLVLYCCSVFCTFRFMCTAKAFYSMGLFSMINKPCHQCYTLFNCFALDDSMQLSSYTHNYSVNHPTDGYESFYIVGLSAARTRRRKFCRYSIHLILIHKHQLYQHYHHLYYVGAPLRGE